MIKRKKYEEIILFLIVVAFLCVFCGKYLVNRFLCFVCFVSCNFCSHWQVHMDLLNIGMVAGNGQLLPVSRHLQDINMLQWVLVSLTLCLFYLTIYFVSTNIDNF